jgi:hypothetical protein
MISYGLNNIETVHFEKTFSASTLSTTINNLPMDNRKLTLIFSWQKGGQWYNKVYNYFSGNNYCEAGSFVG